MHPLYDEFRSYLDAEEKEKCVRFVLSSLQNQAIDIVTLYNEILTPAMYADFCKEKEKEICVWKEHVRTSIVRTIIECAYPYTIQERDNKYGLSTKGKVVVVCPPEELHELGARIIADFFTLCGFKTTFAGANTPTTEIVNAVKYVDPDFVAVSITNFYNLVATRRLIAYIREIKTGTGRRIILGGQACRENPDTCREMGVDMVLQTFDDIEKLAKGEHDAAL